MFWGQSYSKRRNELTFELHVIFFVVKWTGNDRQVNGFQIML